MTAPSKIHTLVIGFEPPLHKPLSSSAFEPSQHQGPPTELTNLPHHQREVATLGDSSIGVHPDSGSMNLSTTYPHRAHKESIRSTSKQVDLTTKKHLEEFDRCLQSYLAAQNFTRVPSHSLGHSSDSNTRQQYGSSVRTNTTVLRRQEQPTQMEPNTLLPSSSSYINSLMLMHGSGSSIGRKPSFEHDDDRCMPSTSGIASLQRAHPADTGISFFSLNFTNNLSSRKGVCNICLTGR
nr:uncharacterized protein LOC129267894 [Lytechinus pictus]